MWELLERPQLDRPRQEQRQVLQRGQAPELVQLPDR